MGILDFVRKAIIVEGVDHLLRGGKKNSRSGYDPGAWRRDLDKENDSYRHFYNDEDNF